MAPTLLDALSTRKETWTIKVKVLRLWDSTNLSTNELISTDMILSDKKGNAIHASIGNKLVNKFKPKIRENSIYILKNFKVWEYDKFRPLKNKLKIIFFFDTTVKEVVEESPNFLDYYFEFADSDTLQSRKDIDGQCSDVIGLLTQIKPIEQRIIAKNTSRERISNIREIEVLLLDGEKIKITLWGDILANMVDEDLLDKQTILIVTSNLVKEFYGLSLRTTNASKVYLDIEIPETKQIIERHCTKDVFPTMMEVDESTQGTIEQQMFFNRKTLREIIELRYSDVKKKEFVCTTKARIDEIIADKGWWYRACKVCFCATRKQNDNYICHSCNEVPKDVDLQYLINAKISDDTATTTCAIFNEVAEKLLGNKSVSNMLEHDGFSNTVPDAIQNLCGTTLIFRLKLNSRNLQECMENFKVNYTFVPNDKLEMEYSNERAEEVILDNQGKQDSTDSVLQKTDNEDKHYSNSTKKKLKGCNNDACEMEGSPSTDKELSRKIKKERSSGRSRKDASKVASRKSENTITDQKHPDDEKESHIDSEGRDKKRNQARDKDVRKVSSRKSKKIATKNKLPDDEEESNPYSEEVKEDKYGKITTNEFEENLPNGQNSSIDLIIIDDSDEECKEKIDHLKKSPRKKSKKFVRIKKINNEVNEEEKDDRKNADSLFRIKRKVTRNKYITGNEVEEEKKDDSTGTNSDSSNEREDIKETEFSDKEDGSSQKGSIITNEGAEDLNGKTASKTKKRKTICGDKRKISSEKNSTPVKLHPNQDRPKRIKKTPVKYTY